MRVGSHSLAEFPLAAVVRRRSNPRSACSDAPGRRGVRWRAMRSRRERAPTRSIAARCSPPPWPKPVSTGSIARSSSPKLDRISREVHFISGPWRTRRRSWSADLGPDVEPFLLHLYPALAEKERAVISQRTKAALAAAKARGQSLGNPRLSASPRHRQRRP